MIDKQKFLLVRFCNSGTHRGGIPLPRSVLKICKEMLWEILDRQHLTGPPFWTHPCQLGTGNLCLFYRSCVRLPCREISITDSLHYPSLCSKLFLNHMVGRIVQRNLWRHASKPVHRTGNGDCSHLHCDCIAFQNKTNRENGIIGQVYLYMAN